MPDPRTLSKSHNPPAVPVHAPYIPAASGETFITSVGVV